MASGDSSEQQSHSWYSPSGFISGVKNTASSLYTSLGFGPQEGGPQKEEPRMAENKGEEQVNKPRGHGALQHTQSGDSEKLIDDCMKETKIADLLSRNKELSDKLKEREQQILLLRNEADVIQRRNLTLESNKKELESNKKELESKIQGLDKRLAQMSKLRQNRGGKGEDQSNVAMLQEHVKEQSRVIVSLKKDQEQRDVEASEDKGKIHELEDEILRLQEDFQSARESMEQLKQQNKKLLSGRYIPKTEPAGGDEDYCSNARCQAMQHQIYALQEETEEKTRSITSLEKTVAHFQQEKNEAMEQVALAKVEAEIFKSDFEEERRDRTRAQGLLADFKNKKNFATIYQEQEMKLRQERDQAIQERNSLKRELSGAKAELSKHKDKTVMKEVLERHIAETERISRDRDHYRQLARKVKPLEEEVLTSKRVIADLRSTIESMAENEKVKQKELQRAAEQIKHGNSVIVGLTNTVDKAKRSLSDAKLENQELKKAKRSLDNQIKKLEKNTKKSGHQHPDVDESSFQHLYDQELQENLELKNHNQFLEGRIEDMTMEIEEHKKFMHDITVYKVIPKTPEEVSAQSAPRKNKPGSEFSKKTTHDQFSSKPPQRQVMERDVDEKTSSSFASRPKLNQRQHSQQNSEYNQESGQSNLDKTRKQVIQSQDIPPIPPRQPCGPSSQIQGTNSSERSRDGRDHEHLHQARQGADNFHSFGDFDERHHVLPAGNRGSEPAVGPESRSTWPVAKNELPLRAGANSARADNLVNQGNPPSSSGYEGKSSINAVSDHGSHDDGNHSGLADKIGKDQHCYESNSSGAMPLRAGAGRGQLARARNYNEDGQPIRAGAKGSHNNHSFATDDGNRVPFRAGQENKHSVSSEMDNQHVLTGGSSYPSRVGYDDGYQDQLPHGRYPPQGSSGGNYPSRRGNHGNYSTPAESDMDVLHNRRERKRNIEPGDPDCLHPASTQSGFMQQGQEQNFESQNRSKSTDSSQMQKYSRENISERRGSSNEISGETDHTGFERGGVRDREQMYGVSQEGATELNQQQYRSREYLGRQQGSGSSNFETTRNEKHQNYGPNSPLLRCEASHHAQSQSRGEHYRNEEQRKPSHPQSMKEDYIEPHRQQVQAAAMASASRSSEYPAASVGQGLHKDHRSGEPDLPHQAKFSEGQTVTAKRVASQNPGRAEYYSEEHGKDRHQATDRGLPDKGKPHSLPQKHHDSDVKDEQLISKDLSAVDIVTQDKNEQKDKAPTTEKNPEAEESKSAQSDASSDTDDKSLHKDIDDDIKVMAQEIDKQVNRDPSTITTIQRKPMDPNLICPICGKQFRIGEIQKFRAHVDNCV